MLKTAYLALILALAPMAAMATGCEHEQQVATCADGYSWDAEKAVCVPVVSS